MVELGGHYAYWNKPITEKQIQDDSTSSPKIIKFIEAENGVMDTTS